MNESKVTVEQYAAQCKLINRRGKPVSSSYIYRLIREHSKGLRSNVPFNYIMEGNKDRIFIVTK